MVGHELGNWRLNGAIVVCHYRPEAAGWKGAATWASDSADVWAVICGSLERKETVNCLRNANRGHSESTSDSGYSLFLYN